MSDKKVFKAHQVADHNIRMTLNQLGPEEKFAGNVLQSLKDKINQSRETLQELEQTIEDKEHDARTVREEILTEAREEAEQIRQQAQQEAREILAEKEEEREDARQEGYDQGYQDGVDQAREKMVQSLEQVERLLDEAKREREAYLAQNRETLIRLASLMAENILRTSVEVREQVAEKTLSAALDEVQDEKEITVILHPEDRDRIQTVKQQYREDHPSLEQIHLREDDRLQPGGCRIETSLGDVDASLEGQLAHLRNQLLNT